MQLTLVPQPPFEGVEIVSAGGRRVLGPVTPFGVFDVLTVAEGAAPRAITVRWAGETLSFEIALRGGAELTYADLLASVYRQHAKEIDAAVDDRPKRGFWSALKTNPLLAPAIRKRAAAEPLKPIATREDAAKAFYATWWRWWLAEFWMF